MCSSSNKECQVQLDLSDEAGLYDTVGEGTTYDDDSPYATIDVLPEAGIDADKEGDYMDMTMGDTNSSMTDEEEIYVVPFSSRSDNGQEECDDEELYIVPGISSNNSSSVMAPATSTGLTDGDEKGKEDNYVAFLAAEAKNSSDKLLQQADATNGKSLHISEDTAN